LNKTHIPESIKRLVRTEVDKALDKAQDEIANTIHSIKDGSYNKIGVDIAINHLRGIREFMTFLQEADQILQEEDPDDTI
jgi:hypothetical protein